MDTVLPVASCRMHRGPFIKEGNVIKVSSDELYKVYKLYILNMHIATHSAYQWDNAF